MEWQVEGGDEKEVLDFYKSEGAPTIAASPDVLRFRMFEIKTATVLQADSYKTIEKQNLHTYLTVAELESEEWPWDAVVALGEKPKWKEYFEGQKIVVSEVVLQMLYHPADEKQKWQSSHYVVKRGYPPDEENEDEA